VPLKVFIYAQDTRGLGHVRRCGTLARTLLERRSDAAVLLATKSRWAARLDLGDRFDVLKLPAQLTLGAAPAGEREAEKAAIRALRRDLLRDAVARFRPRLILVDNEPLGFGGEMTGALEAAPADATVVFGMRDVIDDPARTMAQWAQLGVRRALETRFDRILIYGHPDIFDTLATYDLGSAAAGKASYAGYVCASHSNRRPSRLLDELGFHDEPMVLVTGGGGQDALPLFSAVLGATGLLAGEPAPRLLLATGPFMPADDRRRIQTLASGGQHVVRESIDIVEAMGAARAVATMGGYNTLAEAIMVGRRPIIVPRATRKREQLIRAQAFASAGLAHCLPPLDATAEAMAQALEVELAREEPLDAGRFLDLDGHRSVDLLLEALEP
jgi:predicted glycosyltransferase